jgi:hypothetical protein
MSDDGQFGQQGYFDTGSLSQMIQFLIDQRLGHARTNVPVKVVAVHGGGVAAPPTVDVQVMVKQSDGVGNTISHATIYGIPAARNQGGLNAVINDPIVGDVGQMSVHDRDTSSLRANAGAESNPGSQRRHDLADGVYERGMLNPTAPNQYVHFTSGGIEIHDKNGNSIVMGSNGVTINGVLISQAGVLSNATDVLNTALTSLTTHIHPGTQPPVPGT